jgi:predicted enzyme related to lactoylglutathione lyase
VERVLGVGGYFLPAAGPVADVAGEVQEMDGVGRLGWVTDPDGNRVEWWQPS